MPHKILTFAPFDLNWCYTVSQINKVWLPYIVCLVFGVLSSLIARLHADARDL